MSRATIDADAVIRAVDPLEQPPAAAEIESALMRLRPQLTPPAPHPSRPGRPLSRRRIAVAGSLAAAAAAAAFAAANVLPSDHAPGAVGSAWAKQVIAGVAAAATPGNGILHVDAVSTSTAVSTSSGQPAMVHRPIEVDSWYEQDAPHSFWATVRIGGDIGYTTVIGNQVTNYDTGTDQLITGMKGALPPMAVDPALASVSAVGGDSRPGDAGATAAQTIASLVNAGGVNVDANASVDGSPAISIASADGKTTLYVTPRTYTPIELVDGSTNPTIVTTTRFTTYETLPDGSVTAPNLAQEHPNATLVR